MARTWGRSSGRERSSTGALPPRKRERRGWTNEGRQRDETDAGDGWERDPAWSCRLKGGLRRDEAGHAHDGEGLRTATAGTSPRKRPRQLIADKAYDCDDFGAWLRQKGVIPCIPPRQNRTGRRKTLDEEYKERGPSNGPSPGWELPPPPRALRAADLPVRCVLHRGLPTHLLEAGCKTASGVS